VWSEELLEIDARIPVALNFAFVGNPGELFCRIRVSNFLNAFFLSYQGTGKTTFARLFGELLFELNLRKKKGNQFDFHETTGEAAVRNFKNSNVYLQLTSRPPDI